MRHKAHLGGHYKKMLENPDLHDITKQLKL